VYLIVLLLAASALYADDLALVIHAQTDFERVQLSASPTLSDAIACVQTQAAVMPVTAPADLSRIHYRKGYCLLLQGVLTHDASEDRQAAGEFDKAVETWPEKTNGPVSPALQVLSAIAQLKASPDPADLPKLDSKLGAPSNVCPAQPMTADECRSVLETGRLWQGWIAEREGHLADAARIYQGFPNSGWPSWIAGRQAMQSNRYADAAPALEKAVNAWVMAEKYPVSFMEALVKPDPDLAEAQIELGRAQLLSGQYQAALSSFDASLKRQPGDAFAIFLRARAHDLLREQPAAIADYQLASRTAFAEVRAPFSSGQAHLYRGIWLYRRKDFNHAEEEFASALNFDPGPAIRPDALAWWRMAAVAGGACQTSTSLLESSLISASPFFPKNEAQDLIHACRVQREDARNTPSLP
jgi:tetratricopeptide (TPR) repeat protein